MDHNAPPQGDGTSWETAFDSLQDALASARTLATVGPVHFWITKGVYRPDVGDGLEAGDRTLSFELFDGAVLLGGFVGNEQSATERDPEANNTALSGDLLLNDELGGIDDNSHHIVTTCTGCDGLAVVDGLIIRNGNADRGMTEGGGIRIEGDLEVHIINCFIRSNFAMKGAGIAVCDGTALIDGCTLKVNHASVDAAGLFVHGGSVVTIVDTTLFNNESPENEHDVVVDFGSRVFVTNSQLESVWSIGTIDSGGDNTGANLHIAGDYQQENDSFAGVMEFDIGGTEPGVTHDQVDIGGNASLRGVAHLLLIDDYAPDGPEVFRLVLAGSILKHFDGALFPDIGNDRTFSLVQSGGVLAGGDEVDGVVDEVGNVLDFGEAVQAMISGEPSDIALGDFDDNTFVDAALTVPNSGGGLPGHAVIVVNNGNFEGQWQGFGTAVEVEVGVNPVALAIGDLNGDFVDDLVVANYDDDTVSVLINNDDLLGEAPFSRTDYATGGTGPVDVALADVIGGFGLDIIIANDGGNVTILTQSPLSGGGFSLGAVLDDPSLPDTVDPADLDNDKDFDLTIGDAAAASILTATNGGKDDFTVTGIFPVGGAPAAAVAQDVNDDGQLDLAALVPSTGSLVILLHEGGGYSPALQFPVGADAQSFAFADLDDDGDTDIAIVARDNENKRVVQVLRNDSKLNLLAYTMGQKLGQQDGPVAVVSGDVDLDLIPDIVAGASPLLPSAGEGGTGAVISHLSTPSVVEVCPADIDDNGTVGVNDLLMLLAAWGACPAPCPPDVDMNGSVGVNDLLMLLAAWGPCS